VDRRRERDRRTSISLGLRGGVPLDGSARLDQEIAESVGNGTSWFSSAGNQGDHVHWNGTWQDPDGDDWLNFDGSDENLTVSGPMSVRLQWSDWNGSDQDYDLRLVDAAGEVVATSETTQNGAQNPVEQVSVSQPGEYGVEISREDADGEADFDLFYTPYSSANRTMEYSTSARTITVPATGPRTTAVGAVDVSTLELEPYSSRGPTIDGRRKPAFVAPDGVTTKNIDTFDGTSAAAPHAAGGAAVLLDADPGLSPAGTVKRLSVATDALDYGTVPNDRVGTGLLNVSAAVRPQDPLETTIEATPIDAADEEAVPVRVRFGAVPDSGTVVVQLEDEEGAAVTGRAPANTARRSTVVSVDASSLANGAVTARAKLVGGLGNTNAGTFTAESQPVRKNTSVLALDLSQSADVSTVAAGGTVTLSLRASPTEKVDRLLLSGEFGANVSDVSVTDFRVEGEGTTTGYLSEKQGALFRTEDVTANATVVADVEVQVDDDASGGTVVGFTSEASAGDAKATATTNVTVEKGVAVYADRSGTIPTSGLQEAVDDWIGGEISTELLQQVVSAWTSGEKVA
jgi:hypothetical protein